MPGAANKYVKQVFPFALMNIAKCKSQLQDGIDSEMGYTQHTILFERVPFNCIFFSHAKFLTGSFYWHHLNKLV